MDWQPVTGSGGLWEYDADPDEPTADTPEHDRWSLQTDGIKEVFHLGDIPVYIYAYCRMTDEHGVTGELSKSYYDS